MALRIETFSNATGGHSFFKAVGHPLAAPRARALLSDLAGDGAVAAGAGGPVALVDPHGLAEAFASLYDLSALKLAGVFVQNVEAVGRTVLGHETQPLTALATSGAAAVLVLAFDAGRLCHHLARLAPDFAVVRSLDEMRLPDTMLANTANYLDPLNFATNFSFFRDGPDQHTCLATANYWHRYGARDVRLWCRLMDEAGETLAEWEQPLANSPSAIRIDSREVRKRFGLPAFTGQLFVHALGVKGHDIVKYALDTYGDDTTVLSCTHDANAWPSDRYAGLPAPQPGERVVLWVQNSHPCPIPKGGVGLNLMGDEAVAWLDREIPPFGSYALDVAELLPDAAHPQQIEVQAGKYFVRPRYEIFAGDGRIRMAHANVERVDLKPDPKIAELGNLLGKGYVLPAPILPRGRYDSALLPTPMSTAQDTLPVGVSFYDRGGRLVAQHRMGCLDRSDSVWLDAADVLGPNGALRATDGADYGHMELHYDFADGGEADGWLHAIFRYRDRDSGHAAETSFGAHIFNGLLTYKGEPQSYSGPPPGLSTRLFLRVGTPPQETFCHLIYTAAEDWYPESDTELTLISAKGEELARERVRIPINGSLYWRVGEVFGPALVERGGPGTYVMIRDMTCRLFGYHGLLNGLDGRDAFCLDHMFGF